MSFKNKNKHKHKKKQKNSGFEDFEMMDEFRKAAVLMDNQNYFEAVSFIEKLARKYPSEAILWEMLANAGTEIEDAGTMQKAFARLVHLQPENAEAWFNLAVSFSLDTRLALSTRTFNEFLRRFPDDERRPQAVEILESVRTELSFYLKDLNFPADEEESLTLACLHEEAQILMDQGKFEKSTEKSQKLIAELPEFVPAYNNLSLSLFFNGEAEKAFQTSEQILTSHPDNFHALGNIVRFAVFLDRQEEAQHFADRLRLVKDDYPDVWVKKVEALTHTGDYEAIVKIYRKSGKNDDFSDRRNFGKHLAAFAFYQLGKEKEARRLWQKIFEESPGSPFVAENLDEMDLPKKDRNVFALTGQYWIPTKYISDLMSETDRVKPGKNFDRDLQKITAAYFAKNPHILNLFSITLERADKATKQLAVQIIDWAATPEAHEALKNFAFSQHGSDALRLDAAMLLAKAGIIPKKIHLWRNEKWSETVLKVYKVTDGPVDEYRMTPKAQDFHERGYMAMRKNNFKLAEKYYQQALEANGADHPTLRFNLMTARGQKGAYSDADVEVLQSLAEKFPDYLFAVVTLATIELRKGNIEAAKKLVEQFHDKPLWHYSEMRTWLYFNLEMEIEESHLDTARSTLEMLKEFDENVNVEYWNKLIAQKDLIEKFALLSSRIRVKEKTDKKVPKKRIVRKST